VKTECGCLGLWYVGYLQTVGPIVR